MYKKRCLYTYINYVSIKSLFMSCCRVKRKRVYSFIMFLNSFILILVITLWTVCCFGSNGSGLNVQQRNIVDYTIVGVATEDETHFQRDIEDVNGHIAMYHSSKTHKGRRPLLKVVDDDTSKQLSQESSKRVDSNSVIVSTKNDLNRKFSPSVKLKQDINSNKTTPQVKQQLRNDLYSKNNSSLKARLPNVIIIGVKKAGTRALLEYLKMHPDIKAPGPEPHFFDKNYEKGYDWYRNQMPLTQAGQMTIEKTPSYFITKDVPARIYNMSKDTKLLVVVRDPVTRAISDYTQGLLRKPDLNPFEQMAFLDNATKIVNTSWAAIKIGMYIKHLEKWLNYFPLKQIHFVDGENLITQPAKQLYKVQQFLAISPVINETHFSFNSTKGFPCLVKPQSKGRPHCLGNTKGRTHPRVSEQATQRLRQFYKPFNEKLYSILNHNFGW